MCGAVIVMVLSRVLSEVHSKDHAVAVFSSRRHAEQTITPTALHHYQGRNYRRSELERATALADEILAQSRKVITSHV